jgi:hypothetical protein
MHAMIHKGEMPFQCKICQKKFREKSNLNYHIKKHNSNEINKKKLFKNVKKYKNKYLFSKNLILTFFNFIEDKNKFIKWKSKYLLL